MRARRTAGSVLLAATAAFSASFSASMASGAGAVAPPGGQPFTVYAGGYGSGGLQKLAIGADGRTTATRVAAMSAPTFIVAHPTLDVVYVSSEIGGGRKNIRAVRSQGATLAATWSGGASPVRLALNPAADRLAVANYDGSIALLAVDRDGVPGMPLAIARTTGSGPDAKRQASSHPHSVTFSAAGRSVYVADLGADTVSRYDLGPGRSSLVLRQVLALPAGSGPRQILLDGASAYVANELGRSVTTLSVGGDGSLAVVATTPLPQPGPPGELLVDASGRWLVVLVRGADVCQVFEIAAAGPRPAGSVPCGEKPRFAEFTADGDRLVLTAQGDGTLRMAAFDAASGTLGPAQILATLSGAAGLAIAR